MRFIYSGFIHIYSTIIHVASFFHPKAKLWWEGRKNGLERIQQVFSKQNSPVMWMHCASLGEFEQGRPLLSKFKTEQPETKIVLTFFSPSGYEVRKNFSGVDWVFYLPADTLSNAAFF